MGTVLTFVHFTLVGGGVSLAGPVLTTVHFTLISEVLV